MQNSFFFKSKCYVENLRYSVKLKILNEIVDRKEKIKRNIIHEKDQK